MGLWRRKSHLCTLVRVPGSPFFDGGQIGRLPKERGGKKMDGWMKKGLARRNGRRKLTERWTRRSPNSKLTEVLFVDNWYSFLRASSVVMAANCLTPGNCLHNRQAIFIEFLLVHLCL